MNIRAELDREHSKDVTNKIVIYVAGDRSRMKELVDLMLGNDHRICQRAAWPLSVIAEKNSSQLKPHFRKLLNKLKEEGNHPAINRNILRAFQYIEIPDKYEGETLDECFILLNKVDSPLAIKVFAMQVIFNLTQKYPELCNELKLSIESQWDNQSAGFHSRGRKILKSIK